MLSFFASVGSFVFVMTIIGYVIAIISAIVFFPEGNNDTYDWKGRVVIRRERSAKNIDFSKINRRDTFKRVA